MPSAVEADPLPVPNGPKDNPSQYKPELNKAPQGDFMRPSSRARHSSHAKANGVGVQVEDTKICVVMVGLPARGKSLIAQKGMSDR
jgi:6-phosphofructo-2-kinase / fructose-2,6-biphosphatase 2